MSTSRRPVVTKPVVERTADLDRMIDAADAGSARLQPLDGVVIGLLEGVDDEGRALVSAAGVGIDEPLVARTTTSVSDDQIGCEIALMFEGGDPRRPIAIGMIQGPKAAHAEQRTAQPVQLPFVHEDGKLVFDAEREVVLRCGRASITLTRAGKILLRGAYLLSRSSGPNRIKGGSIQLN